MIDFGSLKRVADIDPRTAMPLGIWPSWMHNVANVTKIFVWLYHLFIQSIVRKSIMQSSVRNID